MPLPGCLPEIGRVETDAALAAMLAEWRMLDALAAAGPAGDDASTATGFQSADWCRCWIEACRSVGHQIVFRIVTIRIGGRLKLVWPLVLEHSRGLTVARSLGEPLTQYSDVLVDPSADVSRLLAALDDEVGAWRDVDVIALAGIRAGSRLARSACVGNARFAISERAPSVALVDADDRRMVPAAGKSVRRRSKKLAAFGAIRLDTVAGDPASRALAARQALELKTCWLEDKSLASSGLSHPAAEAFVIRAAAEGVLDVRQLRVGDRTAAVDVGITVGTVYRSLIGAYDGSMSEGSPGQVMMGRMLGQMADEGLRTFDLLPPAAGYKSQWATGEVEVQSGIVPRTAAGLAGALALCYGRPLAKRAYYATPAWARDLVHRAVGAQRYGRSARAASAASAES